MYFFLYFHIQSKHLFFLSKISYFYFFLGYPGSLVGTFCGMVLLSGREDYIGSLCIQSRDWSANCFEKPPRLIGGALKKRH